MLYEPPSSIATPFFVAISRFQGFTGSIASFQKAEKRIEKAKDTDYELDTYTDVFSPMDNAAIDKLDDHRISL